MKIIYEKENEEKITNFEIIIKKISSLIKRDPLFKLQKNIKKLDKLENNLSEKKLKIDSLLEKVYKYKKLLELEIKKLDVINMKKRNKLIETLELNRDGGLGEIGKDKDS